MLSESFVNMNWEILCDDGAVRLMKAAERFLSELGAFDGRTCLNVSADRL